MGAVLGDVLGFAAAVGVSPLRIIAVIHPSTWVGALKLALGLFLVVFGARLWHRRPRDPSEARLPKWMSATDRLTPVKIFALGVALAALNARNAPLTIAAGAAIGSAGLPVGQQIGGSSWWSPPSVCWPHWGFSCSVANAPGPHSATGRTGRLSTTSP